MALGVGIIGYGGMGGWHHKSLASMEEFKVAAVHDIDPARLASAERAGLRAYRDLGAFLADPEVQLAVIATPNDVHMELTLAATAAGRHVVVEKPAALSAAQLDRMAASAARNGVVLALHQNRRWDKDFLIVKKACETGLLGNVFTIESRIHGWRGPLHGWRKKKAAGGGVLYDWCPHLIDQIMRLMKAPPVSVHCLARGVFGEEVENYFKLLLNFEDGPAVQIEVGTFCLHRLPRWYVGGDEGTLWIDHWTCEGGIMRPAEEKPQFAATIGRSAAGPTRTFAGQTEGGREALPVVEEKVEWIEYYRNVKAVIEGREEPIVKTAEVRQVLALIEAAYASAESGKSVQRPAEGW